MSLNYDLNSLTSRDVLNLDENLDQSFYEPIYEANNDQINEENVYQQNETNDDEDRPELTNGQLDEKTIIKNLSNMGRGADGARFVYLNLTLPGYKLKDISALSQYKEIQNLEISYNEIKDLSVLSGLPYLVTLNATNNKIEKLLDFLPPYYLKTARFSFNEISEIGNLVNFHYLQILELDHNRIEKIEGLEFCHRLKKLNLGHNIIRTIEGLSKLPLTHLDLRCNHIKKIEGLENLKFLSYLNLSGNMIRSLEGIPEKLEFLEVIDLEDNKILSLSEIDYLLKLELLRDINLHQNPIREVNEYRLSIVFKLPKLTVLDRRKIDAAEKVNSNSLFSPTVEYISARDHMTNLVFSFIQDHRVKESTLPSIDSPYPILILCGPEGAGRTEISKKLVEDYPDFFDFVISHTTRDPKPNERDKVDNHFLKLDQFEQDVTHGKFICCNEYLGNWYGIQSESIERISKQGLACVVQTELEGLLSFKQTYFEPRCVLLITLDKRAQIQRLINDDCNDNECEVAVNRTEWYAEYNAEHPGFFDAVIVTDDLAEGYENLRNLVLTYLGMNQEHPKSGLTRPKTSDEIRRLEETFSKELELPRSGTGKSSFWLDSFLPSNTVTANRSQQSSHQSMDSLSQSYNQNLRLKFGSAPAQLLTKGFAAENSLKKRTTNIRKEIDEGNNVSIKSQISQHISKIAERGTLTPLSSTARNEMVSKSADFNISSNLLKYKKSSENFENQIQKIIQDTPDSSENEDEQEDKNDELSLGSRSKHSSNASSANSARQYMQQQQKRSNSNNNKIKLPPLELNSPPISSNQDFANKKQTALNLPLLV